MYDFYFKVYVIQVPIHSGNPMLLPHPSKYNDKWDAEHVKMPCSPNNLYPINTRNVSNYIKPKQIISFLTSNGT